MKVTRIIISALLLMMFFTSCNYFKRSSDTKVIYTVKSNTLNVRQKRSISSKIVGKVHKGDTIIPAKGINLEWVSIDQNGIKGFVNYRYLIGHRIPNMARVSNMQLGEVETIIRDYLNVYVNWRTGKFWLIMLGLIVASFLLIRGGKNFEDYLYYNFDVGEANYNKLPYHSALIGGLFSVVYMYSREAVLQAMFVTKLWWIPTGDEWLDWYLWGISIMAVLGILIIWIRAFINYGFFLGIFVIAYYSFTAIIMFNAGIFGGIFAILFAIFWIVTSMVEGFSFGSGGGVDFSSPKSSGPKKMSRQEHMDIFLRKKNRDELDERRRIQAEIDSM